ncbi:MAG: hypothetical protein IJR28_01345, partial [Ottowia sp.]|nr:hypothetical protein [Ottowia sp.]
RGTARFVREAAPAVQRAAFWLLGGDAAQDAVAEDAARWTAWLDAEKLPLAAHASRAAAGAWIAAPTE